MPGKNIGARIRRYRKVSLLKQSFCIRWKVFNLIMCPWRTIPFINPIKMNFASNSVEIETLHSDCPWSFYESGSLILKRMSRLLLKQQGLPKEIRRVNFCCGYGL